MSESSRQSQTSDTPTVEGPLYLYVLTHFYPYNFHRFWNSVNKKIKVEPGILFRRVV